MILITLNWIDITGNVEMNSVKITEQMNNRANTLSFSVTNKQVIEGQFVSVFEYFKLTTEALSGQNILEVDDIGEINQKYRAWDTILLWIWTVNERKFVIQSVDYTNKEITLTENLLITFPSESKWWRKMFSGNVLNAPEKEWTRWECVWQTERDVSCSDFMKLFDRQVVVETFENQYVREIIWRIVYEFCANDSEVIIDDLQNARTAGGVALSMLPDSVDRIQGTYSQKSWTSGAGVWSWSKTFSALDLSQKKYIKFWLKTGLDQWIKIQNITLKVWSWASDYFAFNLSKIWPDREDHWSFDSFILAEYDSIVWSPSFSSISWVQYEITCDDSIPSWGLFFDVISSTTGGFTLTGVERMGTKYEDVRVQYKKPSVVVENFAKLQWNYWFIDYERDIKFFSKLGNTPAPFSLTPTSLNFGDLTIDADITNLKNRQTVRGWEAPDQFLYTQDEISDGEEESYRLDYKPKWLRIYVDTGSWYVEKTVGVENLNEYSSPVLVSWATWLAGIATITAVAHWYSNGDIVFISGINPWWYNGEYTISNITANTFDISIFTNPWTYVWAGTTAKALDFIYNFSEKIVKIKNHPKLGAWDKFRRVYYPYKPVRVRVSNWISITKMKALTGGDWVYDWAVIIEPAIKSFQEARQRAKAEVDLYCNPQITATFQTNYDWLHAWQLLTIVDPDRDINDQFLIQKISISSKQWDYRTYSVNAATSLYGIIEFFQLLLKKSDKFQVDVSEIVDIVLNDDEEINIVETYDLETKDEKVYAGERQVKQYDFIAENWQSNSLSWLVWKPWTLFKFGFSGWETWLAIFNTPDEHNNNKSLKLTTTVWGAWKSLKVSHSYRYPLKPSTEYKLKWWLRIWANMTNVTGWGWAKFSLIEYQNKSWWSVIATNLLFSWISTKQDYKYYEITFTTDSNTWYYDLEFVLDWAIWSAQFADIIIEETAPDTVSAPWIADFSQST